jgi:GTP-binding protein
VLNKADLIPAAERARATQRFVKSFGWKGKTFIISALTGDGCRELVYAIAGHLEGAGKKKPRGRGVAQQA